MHSAHLEKTKGRALLETATLLARIIDLDVPDRIDLVQDSTVRFIIICILIDYWLPVRVGEPCSWIQSWSPQRAELFGLPLLSLRAFVVQVLLFLHEFWGFGFVYILTEGLRNWRRVHWMIGVQNVHRCSIRLNFEHIFVNIVVFLIVSPPSRLRVHNILLLLQLTVLHTRKRELSLMVIYLSKGHRRRLIIQSPSRRGISRISEGHLSLQPLSIIKHLFYLLFFYRQRTYNNLRLIRLNLFEGNSRAHLEIRFQNSLNWDGRNRIDVLNGQILLVVVIRSYWPGLLLARDSDPLKWLAPWRFIPSFDLPRAMHEAF